MQKNRFVYLYEAARYQDISVINYYVKKFLADNPIPENTLHSIEPDTDELTTSLNTWMTVVANNRLLDGMDPLVNVSDSQQTSGDQLIANIAQDHHAIQQQLETELQKIKQEWSTTINHLANNAAATFPNPLDKLIDESLKLKMDFLKEPRFDDQLAALENTMRRNIATQLSARMPIAEALEKMPQLNTIFEAEISNQLRLGNNTEQARRLAIQHIIDPIQQLNVSIIFAGNIFSYLNDAKLLFKEFFGKEIF